MEKTKEELLVILLKDKKGRTRRLFFSSPQETTRQMYREITSQTSQLAKTDAPLEQLCTVAEVIAEGYGARRAAH